jgi:hypothetical protein
MFIEREESQVVNCDCTFSRNLCNLQVSTYGQLLEQKKEGRATGQAYLFCTGLKLNVNSYIFQTFCTAFVPNQGIKLVNAITALNCRASKIRGQ